MIPTTKQLMVYRERNEELIKDIKSLDITEERLLNIIGTMLEDGKIKPNKLIYIAKLALVLVEISSFLSAYSCGESLEEAER